MHASSGQPIAAVNLSSFQQFRVPIFGCIEVALRINSQRYAFLYHLQVYICVEDSTNFSAIASYVLDGLQIIREGRLVIKRLAENGQDWPKRREAL
jgi:hypothetical protein